MTTSAMTQPGGVGPQSETPREDADDAPRKSNTRGPVVIAVLLALLALGMRMLIDLIRTRPSRFSGKIAWPALVPHSVIGVVAAPHSVVHIVSAPDRSRGHVRTAMRQQEAWKSCTRSTPSSLHRSRRRSARR